MTDQERETYISACGKRFLAAHAAGDMDAAQLWLTAQNEAVKARSSVQVAALEQCYFCEQGDLARAERLAKAA